MSEMRQDPTTGVWVIIDTAREKRPSDFSRHKSRPETSAFVGSCPFCPGNEARTPDTVYSYPDKGNAPWQIRVFANKFPAVKPDGDASKIIEDGCFLKMEGVGSHEVLVETPVHNKYLALMDDGEVAAVLHAYLQRYNAISQTPFVKSIIIFKNHGLTAGTSLEHPHSQLVALGIVTKPMRAKYEVAAGYYHDNGRCLYSDIIACELKAGTRILMETDKFVVFHPFASHQPFETWLMPRAKQASFGQISDKDIQALAAVLRIILLKLYRGLDNPDYNLVVESAPIGEDLTESYRWHIRIIPRINEVAGFEIGSGIFINTALPEETARFMRDLKV